MKSWICCCRKKGELGSQWRDSELAIALNKQCKDLMKQIKHLRQIEFEQLQEKLELELWYHWQERNFSAAWQTARRLAWRGLGPKGRSLRSIAQRPLSQEFVRKLELSGPQGGMQAKLTTSEAQRRHAGPSSGVLPPCTQEDLAIVSDLKSKFRFRIRRSNPKPTMPMKAAVDHSRPFVWLHYKPARR